MFLNFFAYGKFGSHGRFAIYWISRNNGPRCIGATLYLPCKNPNIGSQDIGQTRKCQADTNTNVNVNGMSITNCRLIYRLMTGDRWPVDR